MRFLVGDSVIVTAGREKGKKGKIVRVIPKKERVILEGINLYTKHIKPQGERSGEKVKRERSLPTANIAILNDKGKPDRVSYKLARDGTKERVYSKTGKAIKIESKNKSKKKK